MSTRERFEQSWLSRAVDDTADVSSPPNLACWDAKGEFESKEAVKEELERCKSRIAGLQQRIEDEKFLKAFCERSLDDLGSTKSVVMRFASALKNSGLITQLSKSKINSGNPSSQTSIASVDEQSLKDDHETTVPKVESLYILPVDGEEMQINENPYAEPIVQIDEAENLYSEVFVPQRINGSYSKPSDLQLMKREDSENKRAHHYDEVLDVRSELADLDAISREEIDDSSDDDSIANMLAIRQSVSRVSQFCIDGGSTRQQLELQATRLSTRFSCMFDAKSSRANSNIGAHLVLNDHMETVLESPGVSSIDESNLLASTPIAVCDSTWSVPTPRIFSSFGSSESLSQADLLRSSGAPLDMRKYIVTTLLETERVHLQTLEVLLQWWKSSGLGLSLSELEFIFELIQQLHNAHSEFHAELVSIVNDWHPSNAIGIAMKVLASLEYSIAPNYLKHFQRAVVAISKYQQENALIESSFKAMHSEEKSSLEDFLRKPIIRFERNTLVLHDLIKYTPAGHVDYDILQKTLKLARHFLENLECPKSSYDSLENQRYLVKHGLIVEKLGKSRKLRHVFLFNDVIVAAKQKVAGRLKDQYDVKWFIPLVDLSIEDKVLSQDDMRATEEHKLELESLQRKVSELQSEYKSELKKTKDVGEGMKARILRRNKNLEKIRKKLMEQEVALVIAMPHMCFRINNRRQQKQYSLMMSSDYERSDWSETIASLLIKALHVAAQTPTQLSPSLADVQNLLGKHKDVSLKRTGTSLDRDSISFEEERLYGCLDVLVTRLHGLKLPFCTFCRIEVDSFGHFLTKAKTTSVGPSHEPMWKENFEVDLDGAQTLRVMCYKQDKGVEVLLGKGAIELSSMWLKDDFHEQAIALSNELTLLVSLKYLSHEQSAHSCAKDSGAVLFGARLDVTARREGCSIPQILTKSIAAIEARGLEEEGLYRISGLSTEVSQLQEAFEKNLSSVYCQLLKTVDIHVVTNLVKLYFRSLPDPLFTERLFSRFSEGIGLADPDSKDRHLMTLFCSLPSPNFTTAVFLMDHLIKVSQHEGRNKMSLRNLATVFGPTVIRPPKHSIHLKTTDQLFFLAANEVVVQTTVLYQLLMMRSNGVQFERTSRAN